MAIPNILMANIFGSGNVQVAELQAGVTAVQLGSDVSGANKGGAGDEQYKVHQNGVVRSFKGENFALLYDSSAQKVVVCREDEGGSGSWGVVFTGSVAAAEVGATTLPSHTGLYIYNDGSSDTGLCFAYGAAAGLVTHICTSNTGQSASWTETIVSASPSQTMAGRSTLFKNRIYVIHQYNQNRVVEIDPNAGTITLYSPPWGFHSTHDGTAELCVAFDRLFAVGCDTNFASGDWALYEFTGGGFTLNSAITTDNRVDDNRIAAGQPLLFTDNTSLFVIANQGTSAATAGASAFRGTPSGSTFTWAEDSTVVPAALRPTVRNDVDAHEDRWGVIVDNDTDPASPVYYITVVEGPAPGTGHAVYVWNGWGSVIGPTPGASVSTDYHLPNLPEGGGSAISQGSATWGEIEAETPIAGFYRLSYRVYGSGGPFTGRVYFSTDQGPCEDLATLSGGGTTISSITGDAGVSLRTVDVDLSGSGITAPDVSHWMIDIR